MSSAKTNSALYCWFYAIDDDGTNIRCIPLVVNASETPDKILSVVLNKMDLGEERYVVFSKHPETGKVTTFSEYGFKHRDKVFLIPAEREAMYQENLAMIRSKVPELFA